MSRQTLGLVAAASLIAGWMLASTASPPVAQTQSGQTRRPAPAGPTSPTPSFEALQHRLGDRPPAPQPQRNPFAFEGRLGEARGDSGDRDPEMAPEPEPSFEPPQPVLQLVGVAGEETGAGLVRTAILSDGREMWLLKAGGALPDGSTVVRVDEEAVVLRDAAGAERVIRLR